MLRSASTPFHTAILCSAEPAQSEPSAGARDAGRRVVLALVACCALAAAALIQAPASSAASCSAGSCTQTFNSTGSLQEWQVPWTVTSATVSVAGAGGGGGEWSSTGGSGALVSTTLTLGEGEILKLVVGSGGGYGQFSTLYGGGGAGVATPIAGVAGGGGSFLFSAGGSLLVAAGGGGAGGSEDNGGSGGQTGQNGGSAFGTQGGTGATQSNGGAGASGAEAGQGPTTSTAIEGHGGKGSATSFEGGGGGGGGLYGGGGGESASLESGGGGGGSSIVNGGAFTTYQTGAGGAGGGTGGGGAGGQITVSFAQPTTNVVETVSTEEALVGETVTYTATVAPAPDGGTVAFEDEGSPISGCEAQTVDTTSGEASCETEYAGPGVEHVTAEYSGSPDQIYPAAASSAREVTVRTPTTTELETSSSTPEVGETVTYTATVAPVPTSGTIAFEDKGTPISGCETQTVNTSTGKATCEQSYVSPGSHSITAEYSGSTDTLYEESSTSGSTGITVRTATTTELKASTSTPKVGEAVTYTATVTPVPTSGTIAFEDKGTPISGCAARTVNTSTGKATCEQTYGSPGSHSITVEYSGSTDTLYRPSGGSGALTITVGTATTTELQASSSTPSIGEAVTYTATVTPVPTSGTIAFEDEGTPISGCETRTVNTGTGEATCEQTYGSPGVHPITAAYSGSTDTLYAPSSTSGATTITVRTATTTGLKASDGTPKVGEGVTYTATVAPAPTSGTVAFEDEGTPISGCGTRTVNTSTGEATCEQTYASPGSHAITAAYSGSTDTLYKPSATSTATTITVQALPTTPGPETPNTQPSTPPSSTQPPPAGHPAASDKPAVVLTRAPQGIINIRSLQVVFRCGSSQCTGVAALNLSLAGHRWKLKSPQVSAAADARGTLTVQVPARLRSIVRHYLVHHRHSLPQIGLLVTLTASGSVAETTKVNLHVWTLRGFR